MLTVYIFRLTLYTFTLCGNCWQAKAFCLMNFVQELQQSQSIFSREFCARTSTVPNIQCIFVYRLFTQCNHKFCARTLTVPNIECIFVYRLFTQCNHKTGCDNCGHCCKSRFSVVFPFYAVVFFIENVLHLEGLYTI